MKASKSKEAVLPQPLRFATPSWVSQSSPIADPDWRRWNWSTRCFFPDQIVLSYYKLNWLVFPNPFIDWWDPGEARPGTKTKFIWWSSKIVLHFKIRKRMDLSLTTKCPFSPLISSLSLVYDCSTKALDIKTLSFTNSAVFEFWS